MLQAHVQKNNFYNTTIKSDSVVKKRKEAGTERLKNCLTAAQLVSGGAGI